LPSGFPTVENVTAREMHRRWGMDGPQLIERQAPAIVVPDAPAAGGAASQLQRYSLRQDPPLVGDVREVSVLAADLRGFTALAERITPSRLARILDDYLAEMVEVILDRRGMVQDFVGDGILAVFGAPAHDPDHVWRATTTAVCMQAVLQRLRWSAEGETIQLGMGVSIHTGAAFAGTIGAPRKPKYAVVGDTVNTAVRLEELNRALGTSIIVSGEVAAGLKERAAMRRRGCFSLRGRSHQVEVYELLGFRDGRSPAP
jgi:class 3 adenylate cyclase